MTKKEFVLKNLGKEIILKSWDQRIDGARGMIVGYDDTCGTRIIVSFFEERIGWKILGENDVTLISSPLNRCFRYVSIGDILIA